MSRRHREERGSRRGPAAAAAGSLLALVALGCPGDASDGPAPLEILFSTPECRVLSGGFPSGFAALPGAGDEAVVAQFRPPAVIGLDLDDEPPSLLATAPVPAWPEPASPRCGGVGYDSDGDGLADPDRSDALGFLCQSPAPGRLLALDADRVLLATSGYEGVVRADPRSGELRMLALDPPIPGPGFDPADWPFWPAAGVRPFQTGFSTRACVYGAGLVDSLGDPIGPNARCDPGRDGFFTSFTSDLARSGDRLFVATSNLIRSTRAQFAPGTLLVFDWNETTVPTRVGPHPTRSILFTSGYNPTSLTPYRTPSGRALLLVGVSGAIALGTGPGLVRSDAFVDVIDVDRLERIATVPLGRAGLGFRRPAIDPTGRLALYGAATDRVLYGVDLAALDDPTLGLGPQTLPIVLDGATPGFPDARVYDADRPFALPKRADGPLDAVCTPRTSVAIASDGRFAVTSDDCDGTVTRLALALPAARTTPIDPDRALVVERSIAAFAPVLPSTTGEVRAIDAIRIRPGTPGVDFSGPDVHVTAGLPEGAVCGLRVGP